MVHKDNQPIVFEGVPEELRGAKRILSLENTTLLVVWCEAERWPALVQLTYGNLRDLGTCCGRLLAIVVGDFVQKSKPRTLVRQFTDLVQRVSLTHARDALEVQFILFHDISIIPSQNRYLFAWTDGDTIASSIVLGHMPIPSFLIFNYTSNEYYLSEDSPQHSTEHSLLVFMQQVKPA